jgi:hypothetical protein
MSSFLAPLTTAMAGALLLNESFTRTEAFSGSALSLSRRSTDQIGTDVPCATVFSLIGVVMIARPTFVSGTVALSSKSITGGEGLDIEKGSPAERLEAVGYVISHALSN